MALLFVGVSAFAYPDTATMDNTWGFEKGSSRQRQIMYYQYGEMNWRSYVDYGVAQIQNSADTIIEAEGTDKYELIGYKGVTMRKTTVKVLDVIKGDK